MGVPGFFSWLLNQYNNSKILQDKLPERPDNFYMDANCLFHPQCFKVLEYCINEKNTDKLETTMINRILSYIDYLINYVNPKKLVYIAVDGVAPLAKINQQRKRRYRSFDDSLAKNKIKDKYNILYNDTWSNIVITPGTNFMEKLHVEIVNFCKNKKKSINIIYSSYKTNGEGEHKIFQHIKQKSRLRDTHVVYGLDADLIFLSMASNIDNIWLLREDSHFKNTSDSIIYDIVLDVAEELRYVSIDETKRCYNEQIKYLIEKKISENNILKSLNADININFCNDFIFLCYFLGNDFLPHFPSIDIKKNGLDIILDTYTNIYIEYNECIFDAGTKEINYEFLVELAGRLGKQEYLFFCEILPEAKHKNSRSKCKYSDPYSIDVWKLEYLKDVSVHDPIKLGVGYEDDWKYRYYSHYLKTSEYAKDSIKEVCESYIHGLNWVSKYYFDTCPDWQWQYPYACAPFISDIATYILEQKNINIQFKKNKALVPSVQLLCVLPHNYINIVPISYHSLMTNAELLVCDMFPQKTDIDMINKDQNYQCIPILPFIDVDRIQSAVNKIKRTPGEISRDVVIDDIVFI